MSPKKARITIVNPPAGCQSTTSMAHALRYERQGRADITGGKLVFREFDHRHMSAVRSARPRYLNGDGMATLDAVKGLPVAGDVVRLFMGKRPSPSSVRDYGDPVELSTRGTVVRVGPSPRATWDGVPLH